jgi:hypothetical protein
MDQFFKREIIIGDMVRMPGNSHTAENIKTAIEMMVFFLSL